MKIGIIGAGVVGGATAAAFRDHVDEVRCWDVVDAKCTHSLHDTVCGTDLVFVCLPTPQQEESLACDISIVETFFQTMSNLDHEDTNFVLRSTVPVGTTRMLREKYGMVNLVHSPEFLTARTAEHDACNPMRMVIGYPDPQYLTFMGRPPVIAHLGNIVLHKLYRKVWPMMDIWPMTSDESEFVKLMQNAFSAIKIATFNEFRQFSDAKGLDWERCLAALLAGGWINPMHTQVPGPDGKRGFGGTCLPKDLGNLIDQFITAGLKGKMMFSALERNMLIDRVEDRP